MIEFKTGDILSEDAEALVNTVNCVGVMGRGIALQFKRVFPDNFAAYEVACRRGELVPGRMFVFETDRLTGPKYIINFPTKRHWKGKSRLADIEAGLNDLVSVVQSRNIRSLAVPPLGSGLGGLAWDEVRPRIEAALANLPSVLAVVYEPGGAPEAGRMVVSRQPPEMTAGRAALIGLIDRYLTPLMDPFVTLLEVHKLMYFMQEAGEPLRLRFVDGPYGPYAENLRHVMNAIEGHFLTGFADGGDAPNKEITPVPGAIEDARASLESHALTRGRFARVSDLVEGFETPFGLELLATVHRVIIRDDSVDPDRVVRGVYEWGERKRQFNEQQILLALDTLQAKGWFPNAEKAATVSPAVPSRAGPR